MSDMTAEQAVFLLQNVYMGTLKNESRITKKVLESVPAEKGDHRPDPISKSAIELVRHIAAAEPRFVGTVLTGSFNTGPSDLPETVTPAQIAAIYEERFNKDFEALAKATPEQLIKEVDFRGMFKMPAVKFLMMGLHHTIHHRGQLSSYLRCMGAKVPSIYGESYDDAQARKAAQA
ncbi:MAG TPA: DinB family protein [Terriglobales bacterium]|nr:DinB family protein [Terriglobales bacterium]